MNDQGKPMIPNGVPLDAITKGRDIGDVLSAWMEIYERAKPEATAPGKTEAEIVADTMQCAIYRLYLLGVEDGMKE